MNYAYKALVILLFFVPVFCMSLNAQSTNNEQIDGIWQQEAYGFILEIKGDTCSVYNYCDFSCGVYDQEPVAALGALKLKEGKLIRQDGLNRYFYERLDKLPFTCLKKDSSYLNNPELNFETFWHNFNDHYCYFEERNIDWKDVHDRYRSKVSAKATELELYLVFQEILNELNDGHASMDVPESIYEEYVSYKKKQAKDSADSSEKKKKKPGTVAYFDLAQKVARQNVQDLNSYNAGMVNWGMIEDEVLYIQVNFMFLLGDYGIQQDLDFVAFFTEYFEAIDSIPFPLANEVSGIATQMDKILSETTAKSCILDMRFNGGGKDEVALEIMSRFTSEDRLVGQKMARLGDGFTKPLEIKVRTGSPSFFGDLYVLTSHRTASAAELLVMTALALPNAKIIGSRTEGIFSDMLDKKLPNGWEYSLSNEVFLDTEDKNYEAIGIPPTIEVNYPRYDSAFFKLMDEMSVDTAVAEALQLISAKKK